ncbi:hypothetical protein AQUCO_03300113v1 [Aquilegia coerulea]|uniref:Uncharacterized protein n=1 Tax=Aquilegia coerulea TaxID=218851 RepID=A0A2G5CZH8_AQUCA|nr:hypothetical protein AQUCO_03300113v1 [Aquilegia coerulea]
MVRFSCFSTNIHYHRSKKEFQHSVESMNKASEYFSKDQGFKVPGVLSSVSPLVKESCDNPSITSGEQETSFSACPKSGEMLHDYSPETDIVIHKMTGLKKSQSLGSALNREGRHSGSIDSEGEIDEDFSFDRFNEINQSGVENIVSWKDPGKNSFNKYGKALVPEYFQGNDNEIPRESIFSIADSKQLELGQEDIVDQLGQGYTGELGYHKFDTPTRIITKSSSLPNISVSLITSKEDSPSHVAILHRGRSSEDLNALIGKKKTIQSVQTDQERDDVILHNTEDPSGDGYGDVPFNYTHFEKEWTVSKMNEVEMIKTREGGSSVQNLNELPNKDFKIKRIQEWVNMIDLEESLSDQDVSESSHSIDKAKKGSYVLGSASTTKLDSKSTHGMEAAKNYVSSLPASSTSAQLANLGLLVVPFLSAFNSLKTLNLSGNAIVRITSGALPRGLHVLNLAKNNISSIEGLRELTRLRVLDLSYNRILRIGHVSCSSLKELYLAGNKISEVEGLHRLLKLNILDLRFNKISTAKCLGQLAANYSSLHAINLEGNPAQRNVGDEHLKKYLQSILPHLVYFNKQTIRASSSKDVADRSAHSVISSHQLDRGMRSEHKLIRSTGKASSSSIHGHKVQAVILPKQSKDRLGRLPPSGTKGSHRPHYLDFGSKLLGLRDLSVRRSQSEGNLGAL